jgi:ATP-dependent Clp protease ATP-binding subunit ClpC
MLLQIMEDGHLSDAKGRKVDFRNTILIMTSNVGAAELSRQHAFGFGQEHGDDARQEADYTRMRDKVLDELKRMFKPEFLNRLDRTVVFRALTREDLRSIVDIQLQRLSKRLSEQRLELQVSDAARDRLAEDGYDPEFGARPLRRIIVNVIEDPLSEMLLAGSVKPGDSVEVDLADGRIVMRSPEPVAADPAPA